LFVFLLLVLVSFPMTGHMLMRWLLIPNSLARLGGLIQNFATIFLGIFIEAVPFLLAGTLVSALLDVFVSREQLGRLVPSALSQNRPWLSCTIAIGGRGLEIPV
jgi:uncharacterized membrane protein YraQ (UPF0718 family)